MSDGRGIMARMAVTLAPIVLITSGEPVLGDRVVASLRRQLRAADPNTDIVEIDASQYVSGQLEAMLTPSLFGEPRAIFVANLEQVNAPFQEELIAYARAPEPDSVLVLRHNGGQRGKKVLDALKGKVPTYSFDKVKYPNDKAKIVVQDVREAGRKMTADAVDAIVAALGSDLRELLSAVSQLMSDVEGTITEDDVHTYFAGRVEATAFNVADAVVAGRAGKAVELSRHAIATGNSPVAIVGAIATKLRAMAQVLGVRSAKGRPTPKMNNWQASRAKQDLRGWSGQRLAEAIQAIATADAEVKGLSRDPEYALERAIVTICALRS